MNLDARLDKIHREVKSNKWFRYFTVFNRVALAAGFIPSGITKIIGERFTTLAVSHPMGNYLEALFHTEYYYPFIGYIQVSAAILLLIPRTATLGAIIYFPIILNICVLSLAVGFDGSLITSPLMVFANLYLLCWDYDKLKHILPFKQLTKKADTIESIAISDKFPIKFFIGVFVTVVLTVLIVTNSYDKKTRNTFQDCMNDCKNSDNSQECFDFCDCIHNQGKSFSECSVELRKIKNKKQNINK